MTSPNQTVPTSGEAPKAPPQSTNPGQHAQGQPEIQPVAPPHEKKPETAEGGPSAEKTVKPS
jgi:hypothetical protein